MTIFAKIILDLAPMAAFIAMAKYQATLFDIYQQRIDHTFWVWVTAGIGMALFAFLFAATPSWTVIWLLLSTICAHFPVFSTALNLFRKPKRGIWYHNISDTEGSKMDRWIDKWYVEVWLASAAAWIGLQFLIFKR